MVVDATGGFAPLDENSCLQQILNSTKTRFNIASPERDRRIAFAGQDDAIQIASPNLVYVVLFRYM